MGTVEHDKPFVAVDWGTSSFRLWQLSQHGEILSQTQGPYGMSTLKPAEFPGVLASNLDKLGIASDLPVLICGMAGAAQGWFEAPYITISENLNTLGRHSVQLPAPHEHVFILPGVKQLQPPNVMRGEETQLLGLLKQHPEFGGVVCLPGTHSKWVRIEKGVIQEFTTCMTGELYALLTEQSVLRHSVAVDELTDVAGRNGEELTDTSAERAFADTVSEFIKAPASVAERLFDIRTSSLLNNAKPTVLAARLSGMLLGFELAATKRYWEQSDVALIGDSAICERYSTAMKQVNVNAAVYSAEALTLEGLCAAFKTSPLSI